MEKAGGDLIPGGKAKGMKPSDFPRKALAEGTRHELEHTTSKATATEIAMDHLVEDPKYYEKLDRLEGAAKKAFAAGFFKGALDPSGALDAIGIGEALLSPRRALADAKKWGPVAGAAGLGLGLAMKAVKARKVRKLEADEEAAKEAMIVPVTGLRAAKKGVELARTYARSMGRLPRAGTSLARQGFEVGADQANRVWTPSAGAVRRGGGPPKSQMERLMEMLQA